MKREAQDRKKSFVLIPCEIRDTLHEERGLTMKAVIQRVTFVLDSRREERIADGRKRELIANG